MGIKITSKKAQLTLFIIIAITIVVAIGVLAYLYTPLGTYLMGEINTEERIKDCVRDAVLISEKNILDKAADQNPPLTIEYSSHNYSYLCYNSGNFLPCINYKPLIRLSAQDFLDEETSPEIERCFSDTIEELDKRGYSIREEQLEYSAKILPGIIKLEITKPITATKGETAQSFEDFSFNINSPLYELITIAREIVNQESQFCYFDYNGYMLLYPQFKITATSYDQSEIYEAMDRETGKTFKFAIRGCVYPPSMI